MLTDTFIAIGDLPVWTIYLRDGEPWVKSSHTLHVSLKESFDSDGSLILRGWGPVEKFDSSEKVEVVQYPSKQ